MSASAELIRAARDDLADSLNTLSNEEIAVLLGWSQVKVTRLGLNGRTPGSWHWKDPVEPWPVSAQLPNLIGPRRRAKTIARLTELLEGMTP